MTHFILQEFINDSSVCDELIDYHKNSPLKYDGTNAGTNSFIVDTSIKASTDVEINNNNINDDLIQRYLKELKVVRDKYIGQYEYCNYYNTWDVVENFNIQHYKPNEGYFAWHTERTCSLKPICNRHLVFMTYLNDVNDAGETEFYHQTLKVKPKKGLTLIWPADWTHTHRGITSPTEEKYILTGWFNFVETSI
jgi:hypothetical protein